jgi:hypothetical protein
MKILILALALMVAGTAATIEPAAADHACLVGDCSA